MGAVKLKHRPRPVEAFHFTGGESNGTQMVEWIKSLGGDARWLGSLPVYPRVTYTTERERLNSGMPTEHVQYTSSVSRNEKIPAQVGYRDYQVRPGEWLVLNPETGYLRLYTSDQILEKFKIVEVD